MGRPKKSFADRISKIEVMLAGLENHKDELAKWGLDAGFIASMTEKKNTAIGTNNTQEKMKAELKATTAELDSQMDDMDNDGGTAAAIIKRVIPKELWKEFGITAKR